MSMGIIRRPEESLAETTARAMGISLSQQSANEAAPVSQAGSTAYGAAWNWRNRLWLVRLQGSPRSLPIMPKT